MKLETKRSGQYVMKREQRGMFRISSRTKIKPKDDVICRIEESISVLERLQSFNQPDSTPAASLSSIICYFLCADQSILPLCVGEMWVKGLHRALMALSEWRVALHYQSISVCPPRVSHWKHEQCGTKKAGREGLLKINSMKHVLNPNFFKVQFLLNTNPKRERRKSSLNNNKMLFETKISKQMQKCWVFFS